LWQAGTYRNSTALHSVLGVIVVSPRNDMIGIYAPFVVAGVTRYNVSRLLAISLEQDVPHQPIALTLNAVLDVTCRMQRMACASNTFAIKMPREAFIWTAHVLSPIVLLVGRRVRAVRKVQL
jgi:hypothetical protein